MDARTLRAALIALVLALPFSTLSASAIAGGFRSQNFVVLAPTPELAEEVGRAAERFRHDLAVEWLGQPLPPWPQPCPITVQAGPQIGAGGQTSFMFEQGRPFNWQMSIQGSRERVLDSVLPHEGQDTYSVLVLRILEPCRRPNDVVRR